MGCQQSQMAQTKYINSQVVDKSFNGKLKVIQKDQEIFILHNTQTMVKNKDLIDFVEVLPKIDKLQKFTIAIENQEIESDGLIKCIKWLKSYPQINSLTLMLKNNEIESSFAQPFRSLIQKLPQLQNLYLDLESNRINSDTFLKLFNGQFAQNLKYLYLNFRDNDIDDEINYSMQFLSKSQIEEITINLEENQLETETICEIIQNFSSSLKKINLIFTCVYEGERIFEVLAEQFKVLINLEQLNIESNITRFEDVEKFILNMNECRSLSTISLKFKLNLPHEIAVNLIKQSILAIPSINLDLQNQQEFGSINIDQFLGVLKKKNLEQMIDIYRCLLLKKIFQKYNIQLIDWQSIFI
ncbi:hypothetical protein TTHERM_00410291 (macronuclear) [Tetrahymena thermophila SB210]|uniref:Kinase domain protein n=1 Tax=Tetrahymena thermophila (strain SB210) TaxID=312017 RepID=A4VDA6_TETTS|nr:hypothetical protein TTHERM_00410291 [Tetrahymena thermophila SB210]EDK31512.2 hypothetical protein TTHERM_00410291 [Tetrahymena thermophila SB210]|eukprot:XP_001470920.2 hypothetical protein TTHERM_00410291 [Tetrahymena thermophila SB210]